MLACLKLPQTESDVWNFYGTAVNLKSQLRKEIAKPLLWLAHMVACFTGKAQEKHIENPTLCSEFPRDKVL